MSSIEDMFAAVGIGALAASAVVLRFREQYLKRINQSLIGMKLGTK